MAGGPQSSLGGNDFDRQALSGSARCVAGSGGDLMRSPGRSVEGLSALELSLVTPLVLLVMLAVVQYGYLYWSVQTASAAASDTARALMIGMDWTCARDRAEDATRGPAVGPEHPEVELLYHHEDGTEFASPVLGGLVTVTVSFRTFDLGLPFLPLPGRGTVTRSATARVENTPPVSLPCL